MMTLAHNLMMLHNCRIAKTTAIGFDSPYVSRRMNRRPLAVFFRPFAMAHPMGGDGGGTFGYAGFLERRSVNPAICRPPRLTAGRGVTVLGAKIMAMISLSARPAHTYPLTQKEARHAVRLWFTGAPTLSLAEWRDNRCTAHCAGLPNKPERSEAFNAAFARELAAIIGGANPAGFETALCEVIAGGKRHE